MSVRADEFSHCLGVLYTTCALKRYRSLDSHHKHNLSYRQVCDFGLLASYEYPLSFFFADAVCHIAVAAFMALDAFTVRSKLQTSALQFGLSHVQ